MLLERELAPGLETKFILRSWGSKKSLVAMKPGVKKCKSIAKDG
jgi:hypothetical protein